MDTLIKNNIDKIDFTKEINLVDLKNQITKESFNFKVDYVRKNIDKEEIIKKIDTYIINSGIDVSIEDVQNEILKNDFFAATFIKDSAKQNIYEKLQLEILKKIGFDVEKLPTTGNNRLFVYNNNLNSDKPTVGKSIDFKVKKGDKNIYIFAKFTKDVGGAQDNQAQDAKHFLMESSKYVDHNNDNSEFWFLGDGEYYIQNFNDLNDYLSDRVKIHNINTIKSEL